MEIKWTKKASKSLKNTLDFWDNRNQSILYSLKIIENVKSVEKAISENPYFLSTYSKELDLYRKVFFKGKFVIFFKIFEKKGKIEIRHFRSTRQKPLGE